MLRWAFVAVIASFLVGVALRHHASATPAVTTTAPTTTPDLVQASSRHTARPTLHAQARDASSIAKEDTRPPPDDQLRLVPRYHERDPKEWQGMRVDMSTRQLYCEKPSQCGQALGCLGSEGCGPCAADDQCSHGERCVLDHCLPAGQVTCRTYSDCGPDDQCMLTGITPDPRGNEGMRSVCKKLIEMRPSQEQPLEVSEPVGPRVEPVLRYQDLVESIRKAP